MEIEPVPPFYLVVYPSHVRVRTRSSSHILDPSSRPMQSIFKISFFAEFASPIFSLTRRQKSIWLKKPMRNQLDAFYIPISHVPVGIIGYERNVLYTKNTIASEPIDRFWQYSNIALESKFYERIVKRIWLTLRTSL